MPKRNLNFLIEFIILTVILAIASYLRFSNIDKTTGWYNDEGTALIIAKNLLLGKVEYLGITQSTLLAARPPLFPWLLSQVFLFFPPDMTTLRCVTASLGVLTTLILFFSLRKISKPIAIVSSTIFAVYPFAVTYSRIGFSYNICALWMVIVFWGMNEYFKFGNRRGLLIAGLALGLATISEFIMIIVIPSFVMCIFWKRWKDIFPTLLILIAPFIVYLSTLLLSSPQSLWFDLHFTFLRVNNESFFVQVLMSLINFSSILIRDPWILFAFIGLFIATNERLQKLLIMFLFIPLLFVFRSIQISHLSFHYLIPWIPLICIGAGEFLLWYIHKLLDFVENIIFSFTTRFRIQDGRITRIFRMVLFPALMFLTVFFPLGMQLFNVYSGLNNGIFSTPLDSVMIQPKDGIAIQEYIDDHYRTGDLILASPALAWTLPNSTTTDYQISLASMGYSVPHFPPDIPKNRLRFDMDFHKARYIIVDNIWNNWGMSQIENLSQIAKEISTWNIVFQSGEIRVFENPNALQ